MTVVVAVACCVLGGILLMLAPRLVAVLAFALFVWAGCRQAAVSGPCEVAFPICCVLLGAGIPTLCAFAYRAVRPSRPER